MRPDRRDDEVFDAITTGLRAEDPAFVARVSRMAGAVPTVHVARTMGLLVAGLLALPLAVETGFYPLGVLGFASSVVALHRLLGRGTLRAGDAGRGAWLVPRLHRSTHSGNHGVTTGRPTLPLRWQLVVGSIAVVLLAALVVDAS
jgi:hypothetical protein